jgi:hypothetical protein
MISGELSVLPSSTTIISSGGSVCESALSMHSAIKFPLLWLLITTLKEGLRAAALDIIPIQDSVSDYVRRKLHNSSEVEQP